jgi:hypothetical protein
VANARTEEAPALHAFVRTGRVLHTNGRQSDTGLYVRKVRGIRAGFSPPIWVVDLVIGGACEGSAAFEHVQVQREGTGWAALQDEPVLAAEGPIRG